MTKQTRNRQTRARHLRAAHSSSRHAETASRKPNENPIEAVFLTQSFSHTDLEILHFQHVRVPSKLMAAYHAVN